MKTLFLLILVSTTAMANVTLKQIQELTTTTQSPVVIFDLDDTLFYSSSRSIIIFKEMINDAELKQKYQPQLSKIADIKESQIEYSIRDTFLNAGIKNTKFLEEALTFWKARFFTNEYVKEDSPVEGGAEFVLSLQSRGAKIVYLTGIDKLRLLL